MLDSFSDIIKEFILSLGAFAPIFSCLLIIIESIIPILPLCVFITINFIAFGKLLGFIISWIFTCIGCFLSYYLVKKGLGGFKKRGEEMFNIVKKSSDFVKNISFSTLTCIVALPFTPAFLINIACALSNFEFKKFAIAILIGKVFMVYFWGYIGISFLDCFKQPIVFLKILLFVGIAYILSTFFNKKIK